MTDTAPRLSVVLPAYNEEPNIRHAHKTLTGILTQNGISFELVYVDDGSKDGTWAQIASLCREDARVTGVRFSRNFGKESAIFAGLAQSTGACVAVMDCDMQHPPEKVVDMFRLWENGMQVVEGKKISRGRESRLYRAATDVFYALMSKATGVDMKNMSDFKLMDRKVVETLTAMPERNTFFRALSSWVGYRTAVVEFEVQERHAGQSAWSTPKLIRYAVTNITSFTSAPMQFTTLCGLLVLVFAVLLGMQTLLRFLTGNAVEGFTTVILLILFIGSIVMINMGIIGCYIAKIYDEIKQRPRYLVSEIAGGAQAAKTPSSYPAR